MTHLIFLIAMAVLAVYVVTLCIVYQGTPKSLSSTIFYLPRGGKWIWTAVIAFVAFALYPVLMNSVSERTQIYAFLTCAGLLATAVCPIVRNTNEPAYRIHMTGAYTAAIASQIIVAFNAWPVLAYWLAWIAAYCISTGFLRHKWQSQSFWAEITCAITIFDLIF